MDIICARCGEPWDSYQVLHQMRRDFERRLCLITRCPSCGGNGQDASQRRRKYGAIVSEIGFQFGGDIAFAYWLAGRKPELVGFFGERERPVQAKFPIGKVFCTRELLHALEDADQLPFDFLSRHAIGDWGDVTAEERKENNLSLKKGLRILSSYMTAQRERIWVVTEDDRCKTTLSLNKEY